MNERTVCSEEAAASVLALMVAANGRIDAREMRTLDELRAFERLGVHRERFLQIARECLADVGSTLCECSWLPLRTLAYVDALLGRVADAHQRILVCRLAAAAITADGCVSVDERMVYDHMLGRWRISRDMVTRAILHDRQAGEPQAR
jgi:hypothetical protein